MYDVVIVGAGAAGLTAAIYTGRKKLKTLVITGPSLGGETNLSTEILNYPGYEGPGPELMNKFHAQAKRWGAKFAEDIVTKIAKNKNFVLSLASGKTIEARAVVLAYGRKRRKLGIPGEEEFLSRGVSTCTTCDGPMFAKKDVVIIGGGNAAVEAAMEMSTIAKKVYLVHRRKEFRADEISVEKVRKLKNVELVLEHVPIGVKGEKFVTGLEVENVVSKKRKELPVQGVFIEIGYATDTSMVEGLVETNAAGEIVVDYRRATSTPGLFAAGDLTNVPYKQAVIAAGMGAIAALEAYRFLTGAKGEIVDIK